MMPHHVLSTIEWTITSLILSHQFCSTYSAPFGFLSEFNLFQPDFVTIGDPNERVLYQSNGPPRRDAEPLPNRPSIRQLLNSCLYQHQGEQPTSASPTTDVYMENVTQSSIPTIPHLPGHSTGDPCPPERRQLCNRIHTLPGCTLDPMSLDIPLAHVFRSHRMIGLLPLLMETTRTLSQNSHQQHLPQRMKDQKEIDLGLSSSVLRHMQTVDTITQSHSPQDVVGTSKVENPIKELATSPKTISELNAIEIIGIILTAIACTIAVCVGVGGGGMFVPILILMLGFTTHQATAIAQALMVGGTLAGLLLNWNQVHPTANRPVIDVLLVLLLGPMQIGGANLGVVINRMTPSWLIISFTILVLGFTGYKTSIKGVEAYRKDCSAALERKQESAEWKQANSNIVVRTSEEGKSNNCPQEPIFMPDSYNNDLLSSPYHDDSTTENSNESSRHKSVLTDEKLSLVRHTLYPYVDGTPFSQQPLSLSLPVPSFLSSPSADPSLLKVNDTPRKSIDLFPISGLSDFVVTESSFYRRSHEKIPTSFTEAMSALRSSDGMFVIPYDSILEKHRQQRHRRCPHSRLPCHPFHARNGVPTDAVPMYEVGDTLWMTMLPSARHPSEKSQPSSLAVHGNGRTIILRTCRESSPVCDTTRTTTSTDEKQPNSQTNASDKNNRHTSLRNFRSYLVPTPNSAPSRWAFSLWNDLELESSPPYVSVLCETCNNFETDASKQASNDLQPKTTAETHSTINHAMIGVLYTTQQIDCMFKQLSLQSAQTAASFSAQPSCPLSFLNGKLLPSMDPYHQSPSATSANPSADQRPRLIGSLASSALRMLSYPPTFKPFVPLGQTLLSDASLCAIYTDAMQRYMHACMTAHECMLFECCCFTEEDLIKRHLDSHQPIEPEVTVNLLNGADGADAPNRRDTLYDQSKGAKLIGSDNWDTPLDDGRPMKFRISKVDRTVKHVGQFRIVTMEAESCNYSQDLCCITLDLVEVRPLFSSPLRKRPSQTTSEENSFPSGQAMGSSDGAEDRDRVPSTDARVSAFLVTKVDLLPLGSLITTKSRQSENSRKVAIRTGVREESAVEDHSEDSHHQGQERKRISALFDNDHQAYPADPSDRVLPTESTRYAVINAGGGSGVKELAGPPLMGSSSSRGDSHRNWQRQRSTSASKRISNILKQEQSRQYGKWGLLVLIWTLTTGLTLIKGGKANQGLVSFCGPLYWVLFSAAIVCPALASILVACYAIRLTTVKLSYGCAFIEGELIYTSSSVLGLLVQTFGAGVAAGVVGIGGGMILGPMMLNEGLSPQVATAVNSTLVLFASSAAALNFTINGQANPIWSSFFFIVCFISSLLGKYLLDTLVRKYNLGSILVFLLLLIIILSMISMMVSGVLDVLASGITGFESPCAL